MNLSRKIGLRSAASPCWALSGHSADIHIPFGTLKGHSHCSHIVHMGTFISHMSLSWDSLSVMCPVNVGWWTSKCSNVSCHGAHNYHKFSAILAYWIYFSIQLQSPSFTFYSHPRYSKPNKCPLDWPIGGQQRPRAKHSMFSQSRYSDLGNKTGWWQGNEWMKLILFNWFGLLSNKLVLYHIGFIAVHFHSHPQTQGSLQ